jgi:peptide/nickel transport system substrate-binding protein
MVRYLRNNVYAPAEGGFIPRGMPGHSEFSGYMYQPDSVRDILYRAGYPGGSGLPPLKLSTTSDYVDLCEFVQHQLGEFGIVVEVDVLPASVHRERSARGDLEFFRKSWLADYPDDENFMALFYSENITPKGPNYFFYVNEDFDRLYREALGITDPKMRRELYKAMDSIAMADAPVVPLYYDVVIRFVSRRVSGLDKNPMNFLDLRRVKVE